ncbi:MAG: tetratricopeptide repeat protein [Ignavibacteriaceae bacterium]|nr:tetratricopeptide repeat protein [Ignavibacteriaceae bacterium]
MNIKCNSCGFESDKAFKFCPECGTPLKEIQVEVISVPEKKSVNSSSVECKNCGELNSANEKYCISCGFLVNPEIEEVQPATTEVKAGTERKSIKNQTPVKPPQKQVDFLDGKKLYLAFGSVLVIGIILLLASGVFDTPKPKQFQGTTGNTHIHDHDIEGAANLLAELKTKVNASPNDTALLAQYGHVLFDNRLYKESIEIYERYLKINPNEPDILVDCGVAYFNIADNAKAEEYMKNAIKIDPKHQIALMNLGIIYLRNNKMAESKNWFQQAYDINPNSEAGKNAKQLLESH